jgi:hypothetical protein
LKLKKPKRRLKRAPNRLTKTQMSPKMPKRFYPLYKKKKRRKLSKREKKTRMIAQRIKNQSLIWKTCLRIGMRD